MSFARHEEIYRSDVGLGEARNGNGCRRSPHSSAAMSFQSAIPRQGALQQSLLLLHRLETILNNQCCRTMILQRTATTPLTPCLSPRVHSTAAPAGPLSAKKQLHKLDRFVFSVQAGWVQRRTRRPSEKKLTFLFTLLRTT
jgi:hypothetical protein